MSTMRKKRNVHLIQRPLQHVTRDELRLLGSGRFLFVMINSVYYVQDTVMRLVETGDCVVVAGHKFTNNVNVGELAAVEDGTSMFSCSSHGVAMSMAKTTDMYRHTGHSLLHYATYDDGKYKLVDTLGHN